MKTLISTSSTILWIVASSMAFACHEGDLLSPRKGHHIWGKSSGILQYTEMPTITISISTSCDFYTAFLDSEYDFIQEQVAYGQGPQLDALAVHAGCDEYGKKQLIQTLRRHYKYLFDSFRSPHVLKYRIDHLIDLTPTLSHSCQRV